ncbi:hypothetical protein BKA62DRAFT_332062 [Auriculariales sp. MPI-PUGE-AT-0066]|nr:hypothetical protein BKA62DRAFT_332062 [Auriculariales sp. MPI-PUGE-AT-0066]
MRFHRWYIAFSRGLFPSASGSVPNSSHAQHARSPPSMPRFCRPVSCSSSHSSTPCVQPIFERSEYLTVPSPHELRPRTGLRNPQRYMLKGLSRDWPNPGESMATMRPDV